MRLKIDWASLSVGGKFTVFALFYFVFEGNFQVQAPRGGGGGLIFGGGYTRRSLFSEFFGMSRNARNGHDGESGKKNARGLVKIYKRLQEVLLIKWKS